MTWQTEAFAVKRETSADGAEVQSLDDAAKKLQEALSQLSKGFEDLKTQLEVRAFDFFLENA